MAGVKDLTEEYITGDNLEDKLEGWMGASGRFSPSAKQPKVVRIIANILRIGVITARTRIWAEHRGQTNGSTSYTWVMSLAQVGRLLSETG